MATLTGRPLPVPGQRVHLALAGEHYFNGTCVCITTDRFGGAALILLDCGQTEFCHGIKTEGLGWRAGAVPHAHHPAFSPSDLCIDPDDNV